MPKPTPNYQAKVLQDNRNATAQKMIDELANNGRVRKTTMDLVEKFDKDLEHLGQLTSCQYQTLCSIYEDYEG